MLGEDHLGKASIEGFVVQGRSGVRIDLFVGHHGIFVSSVTFEKSGCLRLRIRGKLGFGVALLAFRYCLDDLQGIVDNIL